MLKYTVKNESGEWLGEGPTSLPNWTTHRADRYYTAIRESARFWALKFDAKVYRVRPPSMKRERRAVVDFIDRRACDERSREVAVVLSDVARRIGEGEHRVMNHGQSK